jgi:hypothetical protein
VCSAGCPSGIGKTIEESMSNGSTKVMNERSGAK